MWVNRVVFLFGLRLFYFCFSSRRRHTRCALVTGVQTCALPILEVADGNGPVNALDTALRKALVPLYPQLHDMYLVDYKVRILTPQAGTRAVTRVMIEKIGRASCRESVCQYV